MTQATNLVTAPEDLGNVAWINTQTTESLNAIAAPDGTLTADKLIPTTASTTLHVIGENLASSADLYYLSGFVRAAEMDNFFWGIGGGGYAGEVAALFDLSAESVLDTDNGTTATVEEAGIIDVDGDWKRIWIASTADGAGGASLRLGSTHATVLNNGVGYPAYAPNGTDGGYLWGIQFEPDELTAYEAVSGWVFPSSGISFVRDTARDIVSNTVRDTVR